MSDRETRSRSFPVLILAACVVAAYLVALERGREAAREQPSRRPRFTRTLDVAHFQKGNVHAHSTVSDGDSKPEAVIGWYRDHGYAFMALTDHDVRSDPRSFAGLEREDFKLIAGEEITMTGGGRQVHVNGLCIEHEIAGGSFATAREAIDHATSLVSRGGGVALINHPNFDWALTTTDVSETTDASLVEVWSGHPYVRTLGDAGHPSHEAMWDAALSRGSRLAPAGVDDAHHFLPRAPGEWEARPGKSWIQVFADRDDVSVICDSLRSGDLYASNGSEIRRLRVTESAMTVWPTDPSARVDFVGQDGAVLGSRDGPEADYELAGGETYVRARVTNADGSKAFLPAYRVE